MLPLPRQFPSSNKGAQEQYFVRVPEQGLLASPIVKDLKALSRCPQPNWKIHRIADENERPG